MNTMPERHLPSAAEPARLDEVMLAMDVVDTLRHQQDLVDHALSEDARDAALVARIRSIYADQGIEVSDAIVVEGVEALKKDRFVYRPPAPSFALSVARLYVDRRRTRRWLFGIAFVVLVGWLVNDVRNDITRTWTRITQGDVVADARGAIAQLKERVATLSRRIELAQGDHAAMRVPPATGEAGQQLLVAAGAGLEAATRLTAEAQANAAAMAEPVSAEDAGRVGASIAPLAAMIDRAETDLQRAQADLDTLAQLDAQAVALARAQAALGDAALSGDSARQVEELRQQATRALAMADPAAAAAAVDRLVTIGHTLDLSYELRIVSRPDQRSGVWRHPVENGRARNYYIIVEAIGADGRPLPLPVTSEEDQRTRTVSTFGVRVPEAVYEQVRADKQDNGLIDQPLFGEKRRGELEPRYRYAVAGGAITSW